MSSMLSKMRSFTEYSPGSGNTRSTVTPLAHFPSPKSHWYRRIPPRTSESVERLPSKRIAFPAIRRRLARATANGGVLRYGTLLQSLDQMGNASASPHMAVWNGYRGDDGLTRSVSPF